MTGVQTCALPISPTTPVTVAVAREGSDATLSVRNMGVPIPPDTLDRIFESLVRGDAGADGPVGAHLGLGLFITSRIVRSHGGSIGVESAADGTVFTCRLPLEAAVPRPG